MLTHQFHAYLFILSIKQYLNDLERLVGKDTVDAVQLITLIHQNHQQICHYTIHASHQLLVGIMHVLRIIALENAITTRQLHPRYQAMAQLY